MGLCIRKACSFHGNFQVSLNPDKSLRSGINFADKNEYDGNQLKDNGSAECQHDQEVKSMHESVVSGKLTKELPRSRNYLDQYSSVEISNNSVDFSYHFKLWNVAAASMCILVKEDSELLPKLKEGDKFNMKYYTGKSFCPAEYRETAIRHISKDDNGRFRGHYLVHLEILDKQQSEKAH